MIGYISRVINAIRNDHEFPYWAACHYGARKWISRYGYYPSSWPLCVNTFHSGSYDPEAAPFAYELAEDAPVQFYSCKTAVENWKKVSDVECHVLASPFVFARKQLNISQNPDAVGSVYFLSHGVDEFVDQNECDVYHNDIQKLPDKYKPVKICLHSNEIRLGYDEVYKKLGYEVVTAFGSPNDRDFIERLYRILATAKYVFSSLFGSYAVYAVEMGIPFCLYGTDPKFFVTTHTDSQHKYGEVDHMQSNYHMQAKKLFSKLPEEITPEQMAFVRYQLGLDDGISRLHLSWLLYKSLVVWFFRKAFNKIKVAVIY